MPYLSTKTYGHSQGLSACFRQWRATHSHCSLLHGYALAFKIIFETDTLDARNWVVDFGGMKEIKEFLQNTFDHKCAVAQDDPMLQEFEAMADKGLIDLVVLPAVGCEAFAKFVFDFTEQWLEKTGMADRVIVHSVECREHEGNSAIYSAEDDDYIDDEDEAAGDPGPADNIMQGNLRDGADS